MAQPSDEPIGDRRFVAARVKRIAPLALIEAAEPFARPRHIVRRDVLKQLLMTPVVREAHESVLDAREEGLPFEQIRIAAPRGDAAGVAQSRPEATNHVPSFDVALVRNLVKRVVVVLEI